MKLLLVYIINLLLKCAASSGGMFGQSIVIKCNILLFDNKSLNHAYIPIYVNFQKNGRLHVFAKCIDEKFRMTSSWYGLDQSALEFTVKLCRKVVLNKLT